MSTNTFASLRTEGGLLPVDLLERVSRLDKELPGLRPDDYGLAPGVRVADAIVRSWNELLSVWAQFETKLDAASASDPTPDPRTFTMWTKWLLKELAFRPETATPELIDEKEYPVSHRSDDVALHLVGAGTDLDHRSSAGVGRAPHSMVQEFLNRSEEHQWALVTNGLKVRLLRDSSSLTRQAYCEFDLEAIFRGQLYADFSLFWMVCHATRFVDRPPTPCLLEAWSQAAQNEGVRALEDLRKGVEAAIESLGTGLLTPANVELRRRLQSGELTTVEFQRQLLRLVYRLLFLLVAEARDALHPDDTPAEVRARYRDSYSISRLVQLARHQRGSTHHDLWDGLQVVMGALHRQGAPSLGLPALGSSLWDPTFLEDLGGAIVPNRQLLQAIDRLTSFLVDDLRRTVDYRNLGSEELGGVYESLLEAHAQITDDYRVELGTAAGNERKTTGSYYTPTSLITVLLDEALDPVLDEAEQAEDPEAALLALKVLDPAVGSGHFLIAAANRIASRLASARSGETEASPNELRHALRDVIGRCVYGIDVNPMSVELCKVSLWMEAIEPGKPLSFLDHHIVCGNSLLGATPALIEAGIPDEAFKPLTGDDKATVTQQKKANKAEREGQKSFFLGDSSSGDAQKLADLFAQIDAEPDDSSEGIERKQVRFGEFVASAEQAHLKLIADAWCAAFVNLKAPGEVQIRTELLDRLKSPEPQISAFERTRVVELAAQYGFLHLHLTFPDVFEVPGEGQRASNDLCGWSGGFDAVLGNPPWERVKLQEKEWFAVRDPSIAAAPNAASRKRMIADLVEDQPELHAAFRHDLRQAEGESHLLRNSGRFPLGGRGDVNTYAVFAELTRQAIGRSGRVGVIVPTGIATDDTTRHLFASFVDAQNLASLFDFVTTKIWARIGHGRQKFCLLTLTGDDRQVINPEFAFFCETPDDLEVPDKKFSLNAQDFALLNPNTKTSPIFRSKRDAELTRRIYSGMPVMVDDTNLEGNRWGVSFQRMFDMSNDSSIFMTSNQLELLGGSRQGNQYSLDKVRYWPLYEAKMIHHFDHRWATYSNGEVVDVPLSDKEDPSFVVQPNYWIAAKEVVERGGGGWSIGWRDIARNTDERTLIAAVLPSAGVGNKLPLISEAVQRAAMASPLSAFVTDYAARQKLGGTTLNYFYVKQFACASPGQVESVNIGRHVLELTYTAWDLRDYASEGGHFGPPFRWCVDRRAAMRAEIDAHMFRLSGLDRDDVEFALDTFHIVKRKDEAEFGEYITKRLILERYDAMVQAEKDGVEYETILDPPPADPSLCHPESSRPDWATPIDGD